MFVCCFICSFAVFNLFKEKRIPALLLLQLFPKKMCVCLTFQDAVVVVAAAHLEKYLASLLLLLVLLLTVNSNSLTVLFLFFQRLCTINICIHLGTRKFIITI